MACIDEPRNSEQYGGMKMQYKRNMTDKELFPFIMWTEITLEELLYRYRNASMSLMERHHSDVAKDVFRAQMKKLHEIILEKYGEEE